MIKRIVAYLNRLVLILLFVCLNSCAPKTTGTKQTIMSQTGNNKVFPSNKHAKVKSKRYKASKSAMKSKQRDHALFQGHEDAKQ